MNQLAEINQRLDRLDAVDRKVDAVDRKVDAVDRKVDAVDQKVDAVRQETTAEFKAVRGEMTRGFAAIRQETAAEFKAVRQEMAAEFKITREDIFKYYSKLDNKIDTQVGELRAEQHQLLTGMDRRAGEYQKFDSESATIFSTQRILQRDVEELKKKDAEQEVILDEHGKRLAALEAKHEQS
jgi:septal ring factor EnvC (AmiA/AmiB activator)